MKNNPKVTRFTWLKNSYIHQCKYRVRITSVYTCVPPRVFFCCWWFAPRSKHLCAINICKFKILIFQCNERTNTVLSIYNFRHINLQFIIIMLWYNFLITTIFWFFLKIKFMIRLLKISSHCFPSYNSNKRRKHLDMQKKKKKDRFRSMVRAWIIFCYNHCS